jgi:Na+-driven multidrug efflux pump
MTYFLAIATTNLISPALARKDWKQLRRSTSHFMGLALVFGSLVTTICFTMGRNIIQGIVGATTSPQHHQIIQFATQYAWIRAMVAPFAVVDFCAQSFCLACLDTKTPALAVAVASLVNIVGDLVLSPNFGIQGAAIATVLATVSSCAILVRQVRRKTNEWKILQENEEYFGTTSTQSEPSPHDAVGNPPTRPTTRVVNGAIEFLDPPNDNAGKEETSSNEKMKKQAKTILSKAMVNRPVSTDIPFFSLPDRQSLVDLLGLAGPIFFIMMLKIACYSLMTVQATRFGIIPLAAHNIMMRFFFFFACFGDSLSQASQTFFPQTTLKTQLLKRLLYLSAGVGLTISLGSHFILTRLGGYLIKETAILQTMATYAPYMASALFVHPLIMLMEGTILARRDLMVLMGMYVGTTAVHGGWVLNGATNLAGLWQAFLGFQSLRLIQFTGRVLWKTRRSRTVHSGDAMHNYL